MVDTGIGSQKTPFFSVCISESLNAFDGCCPALLIGQKLSVDTTLTDGTIIPAGTGNAGEIICVGSQDQAIELAGEGSVLASAVKHYYLNNGNTNQLCIGILDDAVGSTLATALIKFADGTSTAATENVTITVRIGEGNTYQIPVIIGDTRADIAQKVANAINQDASSFVTATSSSGVVTITAKNAGEIANGMVVDVSLAIPGIDISQCDATLTGGAGNPDITPIIDAMGDCQYCYIGNLLNDKINTDKLLQALDTGGCYDDALKIRDVFITRTEDTFTDLCTFLDFYNTADLSVMTSKGSNSPSFDVTGATVGRVARTFCNDPASNEQFDELTGIECINSCSAETTFLRSERELILCKGGSTTICGASGYLQIERLRTTRQIDDLGSSNSTYADYRSKSIYRYMLTRIRTYTLSRFGKSKLFDNGVNIRRRTNAVTPNLFKAALISQFRNEFEGFVADSAEDLNDVLIVERASDANRLNVCYVGNIADALRVVAMKFQPKIEGA